MASVVASLVGSGCGDVDLTLLRGGNTSNGGTANTGDRDSGGDDGPDDGEGYAISQDLDKIKTVADFEEYVEALEAFNHQVKFSNDFRSKEGLGGASIQ
ncbi:hypothetical protein Tco_0558317 [Tanacetum coccineum]